MIRSIILFAFILLGMASCVVGEDEYASASDFGNVVEIGDSLPRFSVTLSNGSTLSNESLKGRVAVLTFFNTACGDCRRELPLIQEAYSVYADRVSFACISRAEKEASVASYWQLHGLSMPFSGQADETVYHAFAKHTIPRIYVVDQAGVSRYHYVEHMQFNDQQESLRLLLAD